MSRMSEEIAILAEKVVALPGWEWTEGMMPRAHRFETDASVGQRLWFQASATSEDPSRRDETHSGESDLHPDGRQFGIMRWGDDDFVSLPIRFGAGWLPDLLDMQTGYAMFDALKIQDKVLRVFREGNDTMFEVTDRERGVSATGQTPGIAVAWMMFHLGGNE